MHTITIELINSFKNYLIDEEKAPATITKYVRDVRLLLNWTRSSDVDKTIILTYKAYLMEIYAPASVNAAIASLNSFFNYCEWYELRIKSLKTQRQVFASQDSELTKKEYERLLKAAEVKQNRRFSLLMQTICSTEFVCPSFGLLLWKVFLAAVPIPDAKERTALFFCLPHCMSF